MRTGFAIAIAWPETKCKQPGAWYDNFMEKLGYNENQYYQVGHAAVVLVDSKTGHCHYFDFGRYHAPFGHGRVRDAITDHELTMTSKASIQNKKIGNFPEIINELLDNKACHGSGYITASYCRIDFKKAYKKAKKIQENSPLEYGPFVLWGTNCSRFVRSIVLSGKPPLFNYLKMAFPFSISPTPKGNITCLKHKFTTPNNKDLSYV